MQRLTIILTNKPMSPLEGVIFEGAKVQDIFVDNIDNIEDVLDKAEAFVETIEGRETTTISMKIVKEDGCTIFNGYTQNGSLSGIRVS